jgi:hypothetical protein
VPTRPVPAVTGAQNTDAQDSAAQDNDAGALVNG